MPGFKLEEKLLLAILISVSFVFGLSEAVFSAEEAQSQETSNNKEVLKKMSLLLYEAEQCEKEKDWLKALAIYKATSKLGNQKFGDLWSDGIIAWKEVDLLYLIGREKKARELANSIALPELNVCTAESPFPAPMPDLSLRFKRLEMLKKGVEIKSEDYPKTKLHLKNLKTGEVKETEWILLNVAFNNELSIGRPLMVSTCNVPKSWTPHMTLPMKSHYRVDFLNP